MLENTVLGKIVEDKKVWVDARKQTQPLADFQPDVVATDRNFYAALNQSHKVFILECKKASPSKGLIRADFDLDLIAGVYKNHASAISVLTDEKYFQGDFNYVTRVRNQVTQPVLCKDFMIDEYQVYLARYHQADAILLMLSVLDDETYSRLADLAHSLKMGVLTEVSNEQELARAITLDARVVGINNRNLRDLSTSLERTKELAPGIPKDRIIISESGIYTHSQVKALGHYADGFLVGSSLMSQDNIELACRKLILGNNKVCGLTRPEDAASAYQAGAVHGGLIFAPGSPRQIDLEHARLTMMGAPLDYVGVFKDQAMEEVVCIAAELGLKAVQLHGGETPDYLDQLRSELSADCEIWKAHGVSDSIPDFSQFNADKQLLDTRVADQCGGTGQIFDWSLLEGISKDKIILAGGIGPDNISQAVQLGCAGLDLNSAVESAPGIKDQDKIARAFKEIRNY